MRVGRCLRLCTSWLSCACAPDTSCAGVVPRKCRAALDKCGGISGGGKKSHRSGSRKKTLVATIEQRPQQSHRSEPRKEALIIMASMIMPTTAEPQSQLQSPSPHPQLQPQPRAQARPQAHHFPRLDFVGPFVDLGTGGSPGEAGVVYQAVCAASFGAWGHRSGVRQLRWRAYPRRTTERRWGKPPTLFSDRCCLSQHHAAYVDLRNCAIKSILKKNSQQHERNTFRAR